MPTPKKSSKTRAYEKNAEFFHIMAHPKRLQILSLLAERGDMSVDALVDELGARISNVSQHLAILRSHRLVLSRREGRSVYYCIVDKRITKLCEILNDLLAEGIIKF